MTTGNSWVGGIGEADIIVEYQAEYLNQITNTTLDDFTFSNNTNVVQMVYHYENWSPTADLRISWIPKGWPITVNSTLPDTATYKINETIEIELDSYFNRNFSVEYCCDFGDGSYSNWSTNSIITHKYSTPGTYTITIWARDGFYNVVTEPQMSIITIEQEDHQGTPGFGLELIILATVVGLIITKKRR